MHELQTGIQLMLAVFSKPPAFLQPGKGSFHNPPFRHHFEGMQFATLGDLNCGLELILDGSGKRLTGIAAIHQHACDLLQVGGATRNRLQCSGPIRHIGRRYLDRMG